MSGIFGIFNRNGKSVEEKTINTMLGAMSYWKADDKGIWINGSVSLGHTMLWNTPESKYEHLPLEKDIYVLTMDARIDNRDELMKELELPNLPFEKIGDSEFILAAYHKWGEECPKYLLGDFAFVIWDEKRQQLFCVRDHSGIKPFYYYLDDDIFVFGNDIRGIEQHESISKEIDNQKVLSYLSEISQPDITFYKKIKKLMPATSLTVESDKVTTKTYWKAEDIIPIELNSLEEYAEHLLVLLEKSVKVRLRTSFPVASHLSGGLDSSSISVLAARFLKKEHKKLYTFSWLHPPGEDDNHEHFEWSNGERISKLENISYNYIDVNIKTFQNIYASHEIKYMDRIDFWNEFEVRNAAEKKGVRTILSGWGGDELISFNGGYSYNAELFWQGKMITALKNYSKSSKRSKYPLLRFIITLVRELILPCFSKDHFDKIYNVLSRSFYADFNPLACMKDDFQNYVKQNQITAHHQPRKLGNRTEQVNRFYLGSLTDRIESWASSSMSKNIEYRYPLLDKRLVEFALAIPIELYKKNDIYRYIFRYSISGLIPNDIIWSDTKHENERAAMHLKLMYAFLKDWMNKFQSNREDYEKNKFVDIDKLEQYVKSIVNQPLDIDNIDLVNQMLFVSKYILLMKL